MMKLWNRTHRGCISHYDFIVRPLLLKKQDEALELAKMQKMLAMDRQPSIGPEDYEYCRQIDIQRAQLEFEIEEIGKLPREGCALWDIIKLKLFKWATKGRFLTE